MVVGDLIHIYVAAIHIGETTLMDVKSWNDMTWGNIGITLLLFLSRLSWFLFAGTKKVERTKKS